MTNIVRYLPKLTLIGIIVCLILMLMLSLSPLSSLSLVPECHCPMVKDNNEKTIASEHKLAVIVPFRDRFDELTKFVPHVHKFLVKQNINHKILILNQADSLRFNRGSLINIGFLISRHECDYIAMHDVDLLPLNPQLSYSYPRDGPFHVAAPEYHPKYHYKTFVGGILLITREQFETVNGLSNRYWGWGLEDDEFYARMKDAGFNIYRPKGITTGINDTFIHIHDRTVRKRDTARLFNQKEVTRKRDRSTGINTVEYKINGANEMTIDGAPFTVYHIKLQCDINLTPWCRMTHRNVQYTNNSLNNYKRIANKAV